MLTLLLLMFDLRQSIGIACSLPLGLRRRACESLVSPRAAIDQ
jgi:hypothetical protein